MSLQENIRYVREKKIAGLLNEMVLHILSKTPDDPLDELIEFLEKRRDKSGKTGKYQTPSTDNSAPIRQPEGVAAAIPAPVPVAQSNLSAQPPPRYATHNQEVFPHRSEAIEVASTSLTDGVDCSGDHPDPAKTNRVLAEMFTNEMLLRNALGKIEEPTAIHKQIENTSAVITRKLETIQLQARQANLFPMMKELGIKDADCFIHFATLDIVNKIIKNEVTFQKRLKDILPNVPGPAMKYALHAQQNSETMLNGAFTLEKNAISAEMTQEGGMAGTGTLAYLNTLGSSIIKQIKVMEMKQDNMFMTVAPQRETKELAPFVNISQQFMYNEHKFHKLLATAKAQAQGSKFALNIIAHASINSKKLARLMSDCCLNCFFTEQGSAPTTHNQLVAELQATKEQIRETTHQMVAVSTELSTNIYSGAVHSASERMQQNESSCKDILDAEAEKAFCVPDLEASRDKSATIAELLARIQQNQELIAKYATQK